MNFRRLVALAVPLVVPAAMTATFKIAQPRLRNRRGYIAGFGAYWLTCAALAAALRGPRRAFRALGEPGQRSPSPAEVALLLWPPAGAIATRLIPELPSAT